MKKNIIKNMLRLKTLGILILVNFIISIIIFLVTNQSTQISRFRLFQIDWIYSNCIGFSIYIFLNLLELFKFRNWLKIVFVFPTIILASFCGGLIGSQVISSLFGYTISFFELPNLFFFLSISMVFGISAYSLFILLAKIHTRKIQWLKEKQAHTQIELTSLRTRINPHFLFNTLNSISGLIHTYPNKADTMLQQLSELLRYNLNAAELSEVDLAKEIQAVQEYLEIEKIRFADRLEFIISNELENFKLPPLLLLTLVENAIKHGISTDVEGGKIDLKASKKGKNIVLSVFNTGSVLSTQSKTGFGLKALTQLLKIHYQEKASFRIVPYKAGTLAEITILQDGK